MIKTNSIYNSKKYHHHLLNQ